MFGLFPYVIMSSPHKVDLVDWIQWAVSPRKKSMKIHPPFLIWKNLVVSWNLRHGNLRWSAPAGGQKNPITDVGVWFFNWWDKFVFHFASIEFLWKKSGYSYVMISSPKTFWWILFVCDPRSWVVSQWYHWYIDKLGERNARHICKVETSRHGPNPLNQDTVDRRNPAPVDR